MNLKKTRFFFPKVKCMVFITVFNVFMMTALASATTFNEFNMMDDFCPTYYENDTLFNQSYTYNYSGFTTFSNDTVNSSLAFTFPFFWNNDTFNFSFSQEYPVSFMMTNRTFDNDEYELDMTIDFDEMNETITGLDLDYLFPISFENGTLTNETYNMSFSFDFPNQTDLNESPFVGLFGNVITTFSIYHFLFD